MALHDIRRPSARITTRDLFRETLSQIPSWRIIDSYDSLRHVANSEELIEWLTFSICQYEKSRGFLVPLPFASARMFTQVPAIARVSANDECEYLEFPYYTYPNVPQIQNRPPECRMGAIKICSPFVEGLRIEYNGPNAAVFRYRCCASVQALASPRWAMEPPGQIILAGVYDCKFLSAPQPIRLEILKCWLTGRDENPAKGIKISRSDNESIQYPGSPNYPVKLFHLIRDLGPNGLNKLFEFGCLGPETYHVITHRLAERQDVDSSELGLHETGRFPGVGPKNISASRDEILEEHGLNNDDVDKLKTVEKNQERFLSARKWARELGFASSSAPSAFFERMEKNGLLISSKGPDGEGIRAKLTDEGKRLTRLF